MAFLTNKIRLYLSAPIELWWYDNALYKRVDGVTLKYPFITYTAWLMIKADAVKNSTYSLDMYTEYGNYRYFYDDIPKGAEHTIIYTSNGIEMYKVTSSNVMAVGYDAENSELYVQYQGGGIYRYENVPINIWEGLKEADSKGSFLHWMLKINSLQFPYKKVSGAGLYWSNEYTPNPGSEHPDGYMTGF